MKKLLVILLCLSLIIIPSIGGITPAIASSVMNTTLYPNGVGDFSEITVMNGDAPGWKCVDEVTSDDDATLLVGNSSSQQRDTFKIGNILPADSVINSVTVFFRYRNNDPAGISYAQPLLRLNDLWTVGTEVSKSSINYSNYTEILARPGGGAWTVNDISNLQVGIGLKSSVSPTYAALCTQVNIIVNYQTADGIPTPTPTSTGIKTKWFQIQQEKSKGEVGTYVSSSWTPSADIKIIGFNLYSYISPEVSPTYVSGVADMQAIFCIGDYVSTPFAENLIGFIQGSNIFWQQNGQYSSTDQYLFKEQEIMFPSNYAINIPAGTKLTVTSYGRQELSPSAKYYFLAAVLIYYIQ